MDFKLPHDVVSTCAKRDEPPSRRSRLHHSRSTFCFIIKSLGILSARLRGFCLFSVFSGLITNISVHSCPFVVPKERPSAVGEIVKIPLDENDGRSFVSGTARQVAQTAQQVRQLAGRRPQRFILSDQVLLL